jgi:putative acetyltransferase
MTPSNAPATRRSINPKAPPEAAIVNLVIERAEAPSPEVVVLLEALNEALSFGYAPDQRHALSIDQLFQPGVRFFLARADGDAAACGGVAFLGGFAEVKRMYAKPSMRGKGVAAALLKRLEDEARAAGETILRLETGIHQHEALRFYEKAGFRRCDAFGAYLEMPPHTIATSIFFEMRL